MIISMTKFQFTPLHERQPNAGVGYSNGNWFQFTPLHERQHKRDWNGRNRSTYFNSRLYMRGSREADVKMAARSLFQFTPLHERQRCLAMMVRRYPTLFQFTPLHERQRKANSRKNDYVPISIHASTWEAAGTAAGQSAAGVFQFTPLHERQPMIAAGICTQAYFNSRLYMRGSSENRKESWRIFNFNSRLYMRGSLSNRLPASCSDLFQFTPLHERQHSYSVDAPKLHLFQFTPLHERQQQKCTIFSTKSMQFSTKPCFFYSNFSKGSLFFNSSSIFLINCIFLPAPMSHKKMYESHQRTHF